MRESGNIWLKDFISWCVSRWNIKVSEGELYILMITLGVTCQKERWKRNEVSKSVILYDRCYDEGIPGEQRDFWKSQHFK